MSATWRLAFPKTIESLERRGMGSMIQAFEYEMAVQQLKLDLRWFPVFLKMQNSPRRLMELAEFEFLRAIAHSSDLGRPKLEKGLVAVNPSAQFLEVNEVLSEISRTPGLYCFVKDGDRFIEFELTLPQALLLDLLREDRKYTPVQLLEQAELHQVKLHLNHEQWVGVLESLLERGVILSGTSTVTECRA